MSLGVIELVRNKMSRLDMRFEDLRALPNKLHSAWHALSLSYQFGLAASLVILLGMTVLGAWVNDRIKSGVVNNSAANAALYLVGFVEPHIGDLKSSGELSPYAQDRIDGVFRRLVQQRKIVGIKIWISGGKLAYSSDKRRIGNVFPESDRLRGAWAGNIEHEYDDLTDAESEFERAVGLPTLEVYAPLRDPETNSIIAVGEVYEVAEGLAADLRRASLQTAFVMGSMTLVMIGSLFHIVQRGSRTIEQQQQALSERVAELSRLLGVNRMLHRRVAEANRRAVENNEQFLRRVGADLHDGPAQLIGLGLLRLDALRPRLAPAAARTVVAGIPAGDDIDIIHVALRDSLRELRAICADIAIPELDGAELADVLKTAVHNHEHRTSTRVALVIDGDLPVGLSLPLLTCSYRFVQEGLNNAFRHAEGRGQKVIGRYQGGVLEIVVSDEGDGLTGERETRGSSGGLGLRGLRDRILSMGGEFEMGPAPVKGTRLVARFKIEFVSRDAGFENG